MCSSGLILIDRGLNLKKIFARQQVLFNFERKFGDDGEVDTPVPIPNTEVKHFSAEDSEQSQQ
jgi:hypothetical protein